MIFNKKFSCTLISAVILLSACSDDSLVDIDNKIDNPQNIRDICIMMDDDRFKNYCIKHFDINNDGKISYYEAVCVEKIDISNQNIISIKGVENFQNVKIFIADKSALQTGDLRKNDNLISVSFQECRNLKKINLPYNINAINKQAFYSCDKLIDISIPTGVRAIEDFAFALCTSLCNVEFHNGLEKIGYSAFNGCLSMNTVSIPDHVTQINDAAFFCSGLKNVTIGNNIKSIGDNAFGNCSILNVYCKSIIPPALGEDAFDGNASTLTIYVPTKSIDVYKKAHNWNFYTSKIKGYDFSN